MSRVRQPLDMASTQARGDAARLLLVPSEATPDEVLYERVAPVVHRMAWIYLATDPERDDITQDILLAVIRGAHSVRDPGQLEGWVARVAFNTICNVFRRRKLVRWLSLDALSGYEPPEPHADFEGRELVQRTQRILEHLPVAERMAFTLKLLGNASLPEIAELSACSERTARRRLKSARERFTRMAGRDPVLSRRLAERTTTDDEALDG